MAIIGFIVLLIVGCWLSFYAVGIALLGLGFQDSTGWICLLPAGLAAAVFYFACINAPFTIAFAAS